MGVRKLKNDNQVVQNAMQLYLVTDRYWLNHHTLYDAVQDAIEGGITCVQLREKNLNDEDFINEAKQLQQLCQEHHIPFIINDNVNVMLAVDADGVHVGQSDMQAQNVRQLIGPHKILGVSAQTVEQALEAQSAGADYLGVGAIFHTGTKSDAIDVAIQTLKDICQAVTIPVVAIGGIQGDNMFLLKESGIDGIAVVSAIMASQNIKQATQQLKIKTEELLNG